MSFRYQLFGASTFAALATAGGIAVARVEPPAPSATAVVTYAPDSTAIFGPKQFNAPSSGSTIYTERFLAVSGTAYLLKVENGAPNGSGRVSSGTIRLNSAAILTSSDFAGAPALLTRFMQLAASDTLKVELNAGSGQFVTVSVLASPNPRYPIHGPTLATVQQGSQVTVNGSFSLPAGTSGPYRVHVVNGPGGTTRVGNATVTLNGTDILTQNDINSNIGAVERTATLLASNSFTIKVKQSSVGARVSLRFTATDTVKPTITLTAPNQNTITGNSSITVSGSVDDQTVTAVTVNGASAPIDASGAFSVSAPLGNEGQNTLQITAIDANGNRTDSSRVVIRDTQPPNFDVWHPPADLVTKLASEFIRGPISDLSTFSITLNGTPLGLTGDGFFEDMMPLVEGVNELTFVATDALGHFASKMVTVVRDNTLPALAVTAPLNNATTTAENVTVEGIATDATALSVTVNDEPVMVDGVGAFETDVALVEGLNVITVVATDAAGNVSTIVRNVTRLADDLPPDPATVAPPLDRTVATTLGAATEFLYTGVDPIQTGVAPGTIDPKRVAVLRGSVKQRSDAALTGVQIAILDHPEFGQTRSRADGAFDLAVNGGGPLTINYTKTGFLPVQRQVNAPWQDYAIVDEVVMIPLDTVVTTIDFSTPMQVARGSVVTDADGSRQATIMFPQGTQATMVMPNGSTQPLSSIDVRATEYTVGENGPNAMPGLLPPTSGYTYAAELRVDTAIVAGAKSVEFDRPVPVYIENFLEVPTGTRVPMGFYDRSQSAWIPQTDGRVVEVVGTSGGLAQLSVDTSGAIADSVMLADLGISDAERSTLASLYSVGQTLWRMPVTHFSPFDGNYSAGDAPDAENPNESQHKPNDGCPTEATGSVIECTTQVLGERFDVTGVPFSLAHRSNRVPGFRAGRRAEIRLTGASVPPSLQNVKLELEIAGRRFTKAFSADPNQRSTFEWDGKDAYGRTLTGAQRLTIRVGYVYPRLYFVPAEQAASFGLSCYGSLGSTFWQACILPVTTAPGARGQFTRWNEQEVMLGALDVVAQQQGGWTIDAYHAYDPNARVLYLGDGTRRVADAVMNQVAGGDTAGFSGDGGPAILARIDQPLGIRVAPDGSVYFSDSNNRRVRRISPDGNISTIAGTGVVGFSGDGGPAIQAELSLVEDIAFGPDGSLYIVDGLSAHRIRRIAPDGIITTVAGNGSSCARSASNACGDGGPALQAELSAVAAMDVSSDGAIYIADWSNVVRRIGLDGAIHRVGGDSAGARCTQQAPDPTCGDGGSARNARFDFQLGFGLAAGADGSVFVADQTDRIRRIGPDGSIATVAGSGVAGFSGDGGPATLAQLTNPTGMAVGPDGSLYVVTGGGIFFGTRIRKIGPDGIITTIAGNGLTCAAPASINCPAVGALATQVPLLGAFRLALAPGGQLYFTQIAAGGSVRRIDPFFQSFTGTTIVVASDDGSELFEFDARGRHLQTRDALTKRALLSFTHDAEGRLTEVVDADSKVTHLERNGVGELTAIVSPFGQRTTIGLDGQGWLARLVDPAGDTTRVEHDSTGLLVSWTDAKNNPPHQFFYDSLGLLTRDERPDGSFQTLSRIETDTSVVATLTSAMGRVSKFGVVFRSTGVTERTNVDPAGLSTTTIEGVNGTTVTTSPDGSIGTVIEKSDPRFGMRAPIASQFTVQVPSGLQLSGSSSRKTTLTNALDPLSLAVQTDSLTVNGGTFTSVFDAAARTLTSTSAEGRQSVTQLDALGRVVEERAPGVAPVKYSYGALGLLTTVTQAGRVLRYDYDSSGRVNKVTDPLGRFEQYAYDSVGRVTKQTLFNGSEILYGYDANGNLTSLTPPGRPAHTFAYSAGDLDSVYTPPAAGLPNPATRYTFNLDRQLTRVLRPDSLAIDIAYDSAGRPQSLTLPNGQAQFAYSPTTGTLTTLTAANGGTLTYTYDGSLPTSATWAGAVQGSVGFKYDSSFRVSKIAVNGADSVAFTYDKDNLLTSAGAMTITRDPQNGRVTRTALATDTSTWVYDDSTGAATRYTAKHGTTPLFDVVYSRDSLDRITQMVETVQGVTTTTAFTYDSLGRLDQVRANGMLVSEYEYDANGNRTGLTTQTGTVTAVYDTQDRLVTLGPSTYRHTASGELTMKVSGGDTTTYAYDLLGNLRQVRMPNTSTVTYVVDAQNRRIARLTNGIIDQKLLYQGQLAPVAELDANDQIVSRFVYATRDNVPEYLIKGAVIYRLITDDLGSVRLVVNTVTGEVVQQLRYDEFGRTLLNTNPGFQPFGFAGGLNDTQTQLIRFGQRDYDPEAGRWTTRDPRSPSRNAYAYASNDPIGLTDVSGECPLCWVAVRGAIGGAGVDIFIQLAQNGWRSECIDWNQVTIGGTLGAAGGVIGNWLTAARRARATSNVYGPKPLPPGHGPDWSYRLPEFKGTNRVEPRHFDPRGGEWRWHEMDRHHPSGHWDHNPHDQWNSMWRNVDMEGKVIPKPAQNRNGVGGVAAAGGTPCRC